jgi:hypothetical protein
MEVWPVQGLSLWPLNSKNWVQCASKFKNLLEFRAHTQNHNGSEFLSRECSWTVQALFKLAYKDLGRCRREVWYKPGTYGYIIVVTKVQSSRCSIRYGGLARTWAKASGLKFKKWGSSDPRNKKMNEPPSQT